MSRSRHPLPGAAVLLRHDLADGSHHYDWMIQQGGGAGTAPLVTFRVNVRIDQLEGPAQFEAERLEDHRAAYLEYEGDVSGGRGRVTRLARGRLAVRQDSPGGFAAEGWLGVSAGAFVGAPHGGRAGVWLFRFGPSA